MRREIITWNQVDQLVDHLIPQLDKEFDALLMITCGGIVPGGMLAEALHLTQILTASVDFPSELHTPSGAEKRKLAAWPFYLQFPDDRLVAGKTILVVDDVWGSGRTINAVRSRLNGMAAMPFTCVLHFTPIAICSHLPDPIIMPPLPMPISCTPGKWRGGRKVFHSTIPEATHRKKVPRELFWQAIC